MANTKIYNLTGVGQFIEFAKGGYKLLYDVDGSAIRVMQDETTLGKIKIAAPIETDDGATKGYVDTAIADLIDSSPDTLNTLNEISQALNNDPDLYNTLMGFINEKASQTDLDNANEFIANFANLSGVGIGSENLGTGFTNIPDSSTIHGAFAALDTQVEANTDAIAALGSGDSCHRRVSIAHTSAPSVNIGDVIPSGKLIKRVMLKVNTAWDGVNPGVIIGSSATPYELFGENDANLKETGIYDVTSLVEATSDYQAVATIEHGGSTTGSALILIEYC